MVCGGVEWVRGDVVTMARASWLLQANCGRVRNTVE